MQKKELISILERSRQWNNDHGITGMLIYIQGLFLNSEVPGNNPQTTGRFLQVLEGSKEEVERIFSYIQADSRHHSILKIQEFQSEQRHFKSWEMGFASLTTDEFRVYPGYFELNESEIAQTGGTLTNLPMAFLRSFYQRSLSQRTLFSTQLTPH